MGYGRGKEAERLQRRGHWVNGRMGGWKVMEDKLVTRWEPDVDGIERRNG